MTIRLIEGFDHYGPSTEGYKGWAGPDSLSFQAGRVTLPGFINQAASVIFANGISKVISPAISGGYVFGFAFKTAVPASDDRTICTIAGSSQVGLGADGLLFLTVAGSGTVRGDGSTVIFPNVWNYVELKITSSTAELHLNGGAEIAVSGSYVDSASSISFNWDQLGGTQMFIDDVYICDLSGGHNDDFLGDCHVDTLYPIADGFHRDWTPLTGTDHFAMVDEPQIDGDTSYNFTPDPGDKDTYDLQNLPTGMSVLGAQLNLGTRKNQTGTRQIKGIVRESGSDNFSPSTYTINASYQFWSWLMDTDPAGGSWTVSEINNDEFGIELVT